MPGKFCAISAVAISIVASLNLFVVPSFVVIAVDFQSEENLLDGPLHFLPKQAEDSQISLDQPLAFSQSGLQPIRQGYPEFVGVDQQNRLFDPALDGLPFDFDHVLIGGESDSGDPPDRGESDSDDTSVVLPSPQIIYVQDLSAGFLPYIGVLDEIDRMLVDYKYQFPDAVMQFVSFKDGVFCEDDRNNWCYKKHISWTPNINALFNVLGSVKFSKARGDRDGALEALLRAPLFAGLQSPSTKYTPAVMIFVTDGHLQYNPMMVEEGDWDLEDPSCLTTGPKWSFKQLVKPFKSKFILPVIITGSDGDVNFWRKFIYAVGAGQVVPISREYSRSQLLSTLRGALYNVTSGIGSSHSHGEGEYDREVPVSEIRTGGGLFPKPLPDPMPICGEATTTTTVAPTTTRRHQPIRTTIANVVFGNSSAVRSVPDTIDRKSAERFSNEGPHFNQSHLASNMRSEENTEGEETTSEHRSTAGTASNLGTIAGAAVGCLALAGGVAGGIFLRRNRRRSDSTANELLVGEGDEDLEGGNQGSDLGNSALVSATVSPVSHLEQLSGSSNRESGKRQKEEQQIMETWFA